MAKKRTISSANELTAELILAIPKAIKGARCWRMNVGGAYPIQSIGSVRSALVRGDAAAALDILTRTRPLMFGGLPGLPDICGILPNGRWLGVEVKWGRDTQSDDQRVCQQVFQSRGAIYVIANSLEGGMAALAEAIQALRSTT